MARDGSGTYTRISNSFSDPVAQTAISPSDAIAFFDEVETEMTDSLCRSGKGGMLAPLTLTDGTSAAPVLTFTSDTDTGFFRTTANTMVAVASGVAKITVSPTATTHANPVLYTDGTSAAPALTFTSDTDTGFVRTTANTMVAVASGVAMITVTPSTVTVPNLTSSSVAITGGSVSGITDLAVADGGTAASTAASARSNLGLVIGTDVQAFHQRLQDIATVTYNQGDILYYNGSAIVDLAPGTSGQFLKTQGAGANPVWDTASGTATAATQAEQEAGSSTAVFTTPGRQHFHPSAIKYWSWLTQSGGTYTLQASYNHTSISDGGAGLITLNIATDFSDVNAYAAGGTAETGGSAFNIQSATRAAGSYVTDIRNFSSANIDANFSTWAMGDQA